jgi:hypothetical protein
VTRVVIDTNVFVSALIGKRGSAADQVLRAFIEDKLDVVVSPGLLDERSGSAGDTRPWATTTSSRWRDRNTPTRSSAVILTYARRDLPIPRSGHLGKPLRGWPPSREQAPSQLAPATLKADRLVRRR